MFVKKRSDGFSLYSYAEGKILAWNYTWRNTLANLKIILPRRKGYAAIERKKDKFKDYGELVNDNYYVVPMTH